MRRYALGRLVAVGEADELSARHASYMTSLAESLSRRLEGTEEIDAAAGISAVRDDLRAALCSEVGRGDPDTALRLVVALADYAERHVWSEPWSWSELALDLPRAREHPGRAAALVVAAGAAWQVGRPERCVGLADEALACSVEGEEAWAEAQRLRGTGLMWLCRVDESVMCLQRAVARGPDPGNSRGLRRRATLVLILNHAGRPDLPASRALLDDAVALQHPTSLALAHHVRGVILAPTEPVTALEHQERAAEIAARSGAVLLQRFAMAALAAGQRDPKLRARAITDVMDHYLRVGNRAHLRGFGRSIIVPLAECNDWDAVVVVDAATCAEPSFAGAADRIDVAVRCARRLMGDATDLTARGSLMTDDDLVNWLQARLA